MDYVAAHRNVSRLDLRLLDGRILYFGAYNGAELDIAVQGF